MPLLELRGLTARYGAADVLKALDLHVDEGEIVALLGSNGAGKSTTLRAISGLVPDVAGTLAFAGQSLLGLGPEATVRLGIAHVPEGRRVFPGLTVRENILLALQARRGWSRPVSRAEQGRIAADYIRRLDIRTPSAEKPVGQLSGGNQQKVILARWLLMNPDFLILDEPTRGIDVGAHAEIIRVIEELCARGMSLLVISSELEELSGYAHRVLVLRDRAQVAELVGEDVAADRIVQAIAATPAQVGGAA